MSEQANDAKYFVMLGRRSVGGKIEFIDRNPSLEEARRRASKLVDEGGWHEIVIMPSFYGDPTLTIQPIEEVF